MLQKRALTVNFQRAVTGDGPPVVMEVAVNPLSVASSPNQDATLITRETQDVLLADRAEVIFYLVPTDHPDLTARVTYRIAWREKYMGRVFTQDFVMPDFDCDFDDLQDLGNLIGGSTYVQWSDVSRPGGVAALNEAGRVVDSEGRVVSGAEDAAVVQGHLDAEVIARQQADQFLRTYFLQFAQDQITQVYASAAANLSASVAQLQNADTTEKAQRQAAVVTLNQALSAQQIATNGQIAALNTLIDQTEAQLGFKADLIDGKIPSSQLPSIALGKAVTVADEAAMLALTDTQVQPGDFAVRPDAIFFLNGAPASVLANWVRFQVSATVLSVNGHTGAVVLSAADVGARSASAPVPMSDVSGLSAALAVKVDTSVVTAISNRLTVVENDATIVRTTGGLISRAVLPNDVAFVNVNNLVTKKDGTVLNLGSGGELDITDVTGLVAALAAKVDSSDTRLTNSRTPTAHAASHATGGTDALTPAAIGARAVGVNIPTTDITGLSAIISNNGLTSTSDLDGRIGSLETRVTTVEAGGGGGGGGAAGTTTFWEAVAPTTDFSTVRIKSPFGFNGTSYYYDPAGAADGEVVYPYITAGGHLKLVTRDENAPADPVMATQSALNALSALVATKANDSDLTATNAVVATKANQSALDALTTTVGTKATTAALNALGDTVATKANQSALDAVSTAVATKANQTDLTALTTTVGTKAAQTDLTALTTRVSTVETGKADLTAGKVPVGQIPQLQLSQTDNLITTLAAKADLTAGKVPVGQLPDLATSKITGLDTALAAKADLVGGFVPVSQLPSLSLTTAVTVANRAAMLALNTTQVQPGDVAIITATVDKGSYILTVSDPSVFSNWVKLVAPDDAVTSVNGQTGTIVLGPSDVGARAAGGAIAQSEITGLVAALAAKADQTALTTGLATKIGLTEAQALVSTATPNKQKVDYASTTAIVSLSGQQSVDGTLVPLGAVVLLTAQSSSVNNGIYTVNSGAWTRVSDMNTGDYFVKGTQAIVVSGSVNASTVWLQTNTSGVVGTNANNWSKVLTAGAQPVFTASNGVEKIGNDFHGKAVAGGGIQYVAGGAQLDPNVAVRKFSIDVPAGSAIVTITHNLNTTDVGAFFRDKAAGDAVLLGWKPTGVNTISAEFDVAPTTGQYRVVVMG